MSNLLISSIHWSTDQWIIVYCSVVSRVDWCLFPIGVHPYALHKNASVECPIHKKIQTPVEVFDYLCVSVRSLTASMVSSLGSSLKRRRHPWTCRDFRNNVPPKVHAEQTCACSEAAHDNMTADGPLCGSYGYTTWSQQGTTVKLVTLEIPEGWNLCLTKKRCLLAGGLQICCFWVLLYAVI